MIRQPLLNTPRVIMPGLTVAALLLFVCGCGTSAGNESPSSMVVGGMNASTSTVSQSPTLPNVPPSDSSPANVPTEMQPPEAQPEATRPPSPPAQQNVGGTSILTAPNDDAVAGSPAIVDDTPVSPEPTMEGAGGLPNNVAMEAIDAEDGVPEVATDPGLELPEPRFCDPAPEPDHLYSQTVMSQTRMRDVDLCDYRGRLLFIVNTAAQCGFTPQYEQLAELDNLYRQRGLSILGFLSDDFGNQGGNDEQIQACVDDYALQFEQFDKVGVKPNSARGQHPVFQWLTSQPGFIGPVGWNFNKFLVSADGRLLARWDQFTSPVAAQVKAAIDAELNQ